MLVANTAIALNPVDWKMIDWGRDDWQPGQVPGVDGVGTVIAMGSEAGLRPGTRVAYHQSLTRGGSFAEYTLLRARAVYPVPDSLDDAIAASLPCPGLTAWQALNKLPVGKNRDVLVTGAGGAVGYLLAQLALQRGLRVWVTAWKKHREHLLQLGVAGVFDYRDGQWTQPLLEVPRPATPARDFRYCQRQPCHQPRSAAGLQRSSGVHPGPPGKRPTAGLQHRHLAARSGAQQHGPCPRRNPRLAGAARRCRNT
ncbi:MAG: hypothetical protein QM805_01910 [Pseudomonas sp.]